MKYLCLVYVEPKAMQGLTTSEGATLTRDSLDYDDELRESGYFVAAHALQPVNAALTVRVRAGQLLVTDGPFAETKEYLGGFILIDARDMNEAVRIAAKVPMAQVGSIEVRPILVLTTPSEEGASTQRKAT